MFLSKTISHFSLTIILCVNFLSVRFSFAQEPEAKSLAWIAQTKAQLSAAAYRKIPTNLRLLMGAPQEFLQMHAQSMDISQIETTEPEVVVLVKIIGESKVLETVDAQVGSQIGDVCTARIPIHRLGDLADLSSVLSIQPSMKLKLLLDASTLENKAKAVQQGNYSASPPTYAGFTGKGVLVVTIDTGIDWRHEDFINDRDHSSRILYLWDQTLVPSAGEKHPAGFSYGVEYTRADINDEIDGSATYFIRSKDTDGHGTHVMGIIAGDGSSGAAYTYVGMAPEAQMLVIKTGMYDAQVMDAVHYAMNRAEDLGLPVVINLSLGGQSGAHDGTGLLDQAMNNASKSGKVIIVAAAGNDGTDTAHGQYIHAEGTVSTNQSHTITFEVPTFTKATIDIIGIDLWYQGGDNFNIKITTPNGNSYNADTGAEKVVNTSEGNIEIHNAQTGTDPNNGDHECQIYVWDWLLSSAIKSGTWKITVMGSSITQSGHFDAWIYNSSVGGKSVYFSASSGSNKEIISSPGSAEKVITVASHSTKTSWISYSGSTQRLPDAVLNDLAYFSSVGPTRDDPGYLTGRQKPDICASGYGVISALSANATTWNSTIYRNSDGKHLMLFGTSMAAPHVTGAVALMLDKNYTVTTEQVKALLTSTSHSDVFTGAVPNFSWGYGKLDIEAAMQQVTAQQRGVSIFPAKQMGDGVPGSTVSYNATIRNPGTVSDSYNLSASGNSWSTTIWNASGSSQISNTGNIAAGYETNIKIKVQVPGSSSPSMRDMVTITATSAGNSAYKDQAKLITQTPALLPWSDNFTKATLDTIKWAFNGGPAKINSSGSSEPSTPYALNLNGDAVGGDEVQSQAIDLSGKSGVQLKYYYQRTGNGDSPEAGDDLWVDYYDASNRWINLRHYLGSGSDMSSFTQEQIPLPAEAYHSRFKIRFYCVGSPGSSPDDWFVDDVSLSETVTKITVTYPDVSGIVWNIGQTYNITWTTVGNVGDKVRIELYKGEALNRTVADTTANDGSYLRTVPSNQATGSDFRIKVTSATNPTISDFSDNYFTILSHEFITVTSPNGGEIWNAGSSQNIAWTSNGTSGNVKIEYSTNGGSSWSTVVGSTPDDGSHPWTIPDIPSTNCLVKITDTDGSPSDQSNSAFTIRTQVVKPTIVLNPTTFQFTATQGGTNPVSQNLNIGNTGTSNLNWSATDNAAWLTISPISGSVPVGGSQNMALSANIAGLTAGTYNATITVTDPNATNSPQTASVTLTIHSPTPKPTIVLNPTAFQFTATQGGTNPVSQNLSIGNTGTSHLNWSATDNAAWLTISPISGSVPVGSSQNVTLSVNIAGLTAGTYNATITVTDPNATNSPQTAAVTLTIQPPAPKPTIVLNPTSFQFTATQGGSNPASQNLNIGNTGTSHLNWSAADNAAWLTISPISGSVAAGSSQNLALSANIAGLTAGTYNATITVADPNATNSPQTASVTLTIQSPTPKPMIVLNPTTFQFTATQGGGNPSSQTLIIGNSGASGSTLKWNVTDNAAWLTLSPTSGSIAAGVSQNVVLSVNIAGLAVGNYTTTITVTDPNATNSPRTASITLTITPSGSYFVDSGTNLTPMREGSAQWGDYNNDGYLDVLMTGVDASGKYYSMVYKNNGNGQFTNINVKLPPVAYQKTSWVDSDADGDLDILLMGWDGSQNYLTIYRNDGNDNFININPNLSSALGYHNSACGDYDNDGDLDIIFTTYWNGTANFKLFKNEGNHKFSNVNVNFSTVVGDGFLNWGDYDNDGDLDLLLTGRNSTKVYSILYRNDGNGVFTDIKANLQGVYCDARPTNGNPFGDYDNDGDLDLVLYGVTDVTSDSRCAIIYRNNGNGTFTDIKANLIGSMLGSISWGDYDNDGDLDLFLSGFNLTMDMVRLYRNNGNHQFTEVVDNFPDAVGPCSWGDYDRDGDLDILLVGWDGYAGNYFARIYRNENTPKNHPPAAPVNLRNTLVNGVLTVSWDAATDQETPVRGLYYNLRIGITRDGNEIMAAHANNNGLLTTPLIGNVQQNKTWVLRGLNPNLTYYWAVQTVDGCFTGSNWTKAEVRTSISDSRSEIPPQYSLEQNYPNPFNPSTKISFTLAEASQTRLQIYDITGQLIKILLDDQCPAGAHQIEWDGRDMYGQSVASGVYFYKLQTNKFEETRKMVLVQ